MLKYIFIFLLIVVGIFVFLTPLTPNQVANTLINDIKFGGSSIGTARFYGDNILEPLRIYSDNFEKLNSCNSVWIADVLSFPQSSAKLVLLNELVHRNNNYAKLIGIIGLITNGNYSEEINDQSIIVKAAMGELLSVGTKDTIEQYSRLGIIALSKTKDKRVLPYLFKILDITPEKFWRHSQVCIALEELGYVDAVPILEQKMLDLKFYAVVYAFRALLRLDRSKAVTSAITRISIDNQDKNYITDLILELEKSTGKNFGYNTQEWIKWSSEQPIK